MAHKSFSLQIDEPCSEDWGSMSIQEKGRFCGSCSKVVIDFSILSNNQIKDYFKNYTGDVCGNFHTHQLHTKYTYNSARPWYTSRFIQFALGGLLTLQTVESVAGGPAVVVEKMNPIKGAQDNESNPEKKDKQVIEGRIVSQDGTTGIKDAVVTIVETGQSKQTNAEGKFKFKIPADFTGTTIRVVVSRSGYQQKNEEIKLNEIPASIEIFLFKQIRMIKGKIKLRNHLEED